MKPSLRPGTLPLSRPEGGALQKMSSTVEVTVEGLIRQVQARVRERKVSMDEAYRQIAQEIAARPEAMEAWWRLFGAWWIQASYRVALGADISSLSLAGEGDDAFADEPPPARRDPRRSWMADLNPYNVIIAVADTGRRKRVGDFDAEDARAFESMYRSHVAEANRMRRAWAKVADTLADGRRLEDVRDEVPVLELGLFPPEYVNRVRAGRPEARPAAA